MALHGPAERWKGAAVRCTGLVGHGNERTGSGTWAGGESSLVGATSYVACGCHHSSCLRPIEFSPDEAKQSAILIGRQPNRCSGAVLVRNSRCAWRNGESQLGQPCRRCP